MDCSLPGSSVHGISQAWILEWVAISFSRGIFSTQESNRVSFIADTFFTDWATREAKLGLKRKAVYNWFTSCWSVNSSPTNLPEMVLLCKKDILFRLSFNLFQTEDQVNIWSGSCSVVSDSLRPHGRYSPWNSPVQNTGVGSLSLLQGIFPTYGSNPGLPHCRRILYQLSHRNIWVFVEKALCLFPSFRSKYSMVRGL